MNNLKIFKNLTDFENEEKMLQKPYFCFIEETNEVKYSGFIISEDDITKGEYIDLDLPSGTKWASCNLGATSPCEYGDFYAWGETTPNKEVYDWSTYKHGNYNAFTKYNNNSSSHGTVDNKTLLDTEDDAVYVATNGVAHMPTKAQIDELISQTTSQWCQCTVLGDDHIEHNISGRLFTSKTNGNKIFIPAAGYQDGSKFVGTGHAFDVWSASLHDNDNRAMILYSNSSIAYRDSSSRCYGFSVRGCKD